MDIGGAEPKDIGAGKLLSPLRLVLRHRCPDRNWTDPELLFCSVVHILLENNLKEKLRDLLHLAFL